MFPSLLTVNISPLDLIIALSKLTVAPLKAPSLFCPNKISKKLLVLSKLPPLKSIEYFSPLWAILKKLEAVCWL